MKRKQGPGRGQDGVRRPERNWTRPWPRGGAMVGAADATMQTGGTQGRRWRIGRGHRPDGGGCAAAPRFEVGQGEHAQAIGSGIDGGRRRRSGDGRGRRGGGRTRRRTERTRSGRVRCGGRRADGGAAHASQCARVGAAVGDKDDERRGAAGQGESFSTHPFIVCWAGLVDVTAAWNGTLASPDTWSLVGAERAARRSPRRVEGRVKRRQLCNAKYGVVPWPACDHPCSAKPRPICPWRWRRRR